MPTKDATRGDAAAVADALRRIVRALRLSTGAVERATGLSGAQLNVLRSLCASPAASLRDLARRTLTDPSSVSVVVARLVARRLVARRADDADRRRSVLAATPAGRALARHAPPTAHERLLAAVRALSPADLRALRGRLGAVVAAMGLAGEPARLFFEPEAADRRRRAARAAT